MNRAYSETIVHSRNLDERNIPEEKMNPLKLCGTKLKKSLDDIDTFKENQIFFSKNTVDKNSIDFIRFIGFINYFSTNQMYMIDYVQTKNKDFDISSSSSSLSLIQFKRKHPLLQ